MKVRTRLTEKLTPKVSGGGVDACASMSHQRRMKTAACRKAAAKTRTRQRVAGAAVGGAMGAAIGQKYGKAGAALGAGLGAASHYAGVRYLQKNVPYSPGYTGRKISKKERQASAKKGWEKRKQK